MTTLHIVNRQRKTRLSFSLLKEIAVQALPLCLSSIGGPGAVLDSLPTIEITLVSDQTISSIHKRFFDDASSTDVITFPHGEIIISAETAATNSQQYGHSPTMEIALCIIHGFLHLNGYNDLIPTEAIRMSKRQNAILEAVCRKV